MATARCQVGEGDFFIYFTKDSAGLPVVPRIAISRVGPFINEVRGVGYEQNIDPQLGGTPVLIDKLREFGAEGQKFETSASDVMRLGMIVERHQSELKLTKDDIRFLYELDRPIQGLGFEPDPRIKELRDARDRDADSGELSRR